MVRFLSAIAIGKEPDSVCQQEIGGVEIPQFCRHVADSGYDIAGALINRLQ